MPASGSEDSDDSQIPSTRVERLLRESALRKNRDHDVSTDYESDEGRERKPIKQRLLVVANRLPLSAKRNEDDSWSLEISAGGLVSALVGVKDFEARYIGWPGVSVPDDAGQQALTAALSEKRCIPVFLSEEIVNQYYNGYCNDILWPLFHYLELPHEDRPATTKTSQSQFKAYKTANTMFADVVNEHYQEGDIVWCHDYHLMFLPRKLKEYNSNIKVGWFLHAPFPSSEIFRTLPSRSELLCAVLAADLLGFHTYDYARHFQSACTRILGLEETPEGVKDQGRVTRVAEFPIGIDSDRFIHALEDPQVQDQIMKYKEQFSGKKVILSVDCLHTIKGIPLKILAFEKFLNENQDWHNKVVLLQIAVPTRTEVPQYIKLMSQVHTIVEKVNRRFKTLTADPVHHLDHSLDFHALCALYSLTDVALLTSSRDGMNLVSYEFVACQDSKGVLILNKFAGAAQQSLGAGAILINPWNMTEVAAAISQALNISAQERGKRHRCNFKHVTTHSAQKWAELFLCELNDTAQQRTREASPKLFASDAVGRYLQSNSSLSAYMPASASKDSDDSQISTTRVERLLRERVLRKNRDDTTLNPSIVKVDNQCATTKDFVLGNYKLEGKIYDRLYSYQKVGLEWLIGLHSKETGGILADEMGLGKTLQICSFLSGLYYSNLVRRVMVVAPATLVDNWIEELTKVGLSKHMRVYAGLEKIHGAKCILVTSYDMVRIHIGSLSAYQWDYVIADEGHFIKNPNAQRTKCMHEVPSKQRIIVTGTPMENNLMVIFLVSKCIFMYFLVLVFLSLIKFFFSSCILLYFLICLYEVSTKPKSPHKD